jgi:putative oxidoreductase
MKKWSILVCRYLLGLIFLVNGVNMFAQFMPLSNPQQPQLAQQFLGILQEAGYFYPMIGVVKILTALALITNRFLPLMLVAMLPITLNGILFHLRMDPPMAPVAVAIGLIQVYLIAVNRNKYMPLLQNGHI